LGSDRIPLEHRPRFFAELQMKVPTSEEHFRNWHVFLREGKWLEEVSAEKSEAMSADARVRPWRRNEFPLLADWLKRQTPYLALVAKAARSEKFYQPLLVDPDEPMVNEIMPGGDLAREVARAIQCRAHLSLAEGKPQQALEDIETIRRLARKIGAGHTLIENLYGIALESIACQLTVTYAQVQAVAPKDAKMLIANFSALEPKPSMIDAIDSERFLSLQMMQLLAKKGPGAMSELGLGGLGGNPIMAIVMGSFVDWNPAMKHANAVYDRIVALKEIEDPIRRWKASRQLKVELDEQLKKKGQPSPLMMLTGRGRGEAVGNILLAMLVPAVDAVFGAEARVVDYQEMCTLAIALEGFRTGRGSYSKRLGQLLPEYFAAEPLDTFSGEKFRYESHGSEYLLYGFGSDHADNGGDRDVDLVFEGPSDSEAAAKFDREQKR
jgi:hypothetical protein